MEENYNLNDFNSGQITLGFLNKDIEFRLEKFDLSSKLKFENVYWNYDDILNQIVGMLITGTLKLHSIGDLKLFYPIENKVVLNGFENYTKKPIKEVSNKVLLLIDLRKSTELNDFCVIRGFSCGKLQLVSFDGVTNELSFKIAIENFNGYNNYEYLSSNPLDKEKMLSDLLKENNLK